MRAKIWCEVMCGNCGALVAKSDYYKNSQTIRKLKEATKDWVRTKEYGNLCPDCQRKIKAGEQE